MPLVEVFHNRWGKTLVTYNQKDPYLSFEIAICKGIGEAYLPPRVFKQLSEAESYYESLNVLPGLKKRLLMRTCHGDYTLRRFKNG
jgi:hypothetical protein